MNVDMSRAKLTALLVSIGLLILVGLVLIMVSLRLLLSTASTAVPPMQAGSGLIPDPLSSIASRTALPIQPGSGFPVDTPDFAAFATAFRFSNNTPGVMTPSSAQIALLTEVAQTQSAGFTGIMATITPLPSVEYLKPSGEWATYTDPTGYKFEYPDNWFVVEEMVEYQEGVAVQNSSPDAVASKGSASPNPDKIKIIIFPEQDMRPHETFQDYLNDPNRVLAGQNATQLRSEVSPKGYQVIWMQKTGAAEVFLEVYLTNGLRVYVVVAPAASKHTLAVEHLIDSFVIP